MLTQLILTAQPFWDIDMKTLEVQQHLRFIVERVFEHGTMQDLREVRWFYPKNFIVDSLQKSRNLSRETTCFYTLFYGLNNNNKTPKYDFWMNPCKAHWPA